MKILGFEITRSKKSRPRGKRGFAAAKTDRFFQGWTVANKSADAELHDALRTLRARSRDLAINDDYVTRFLQLVKTNIVGPKGIALQNRAREDDGSLDTVANQLIEDGWKDWGTKGTCTVDGRLSWIDAQNLFAETAARDGEALVKLVENPGINRYGFGLQFVDVDHLDETYQRPERDGRSIRLSIEYDQMDRPTAFHLLKHHPNAHTTGIDPTKRIRVPAEDIIHGFMTHRSAQGRGYPWTSQGLRRLKMLAGYEHAELIASRIGASKMGFYVEPEGDGGVVGDDLLDEYAPVTEADPGTFDRLPFGTEFKTWDPDHPVSAYEAYVLAILRGAASGLGVSYVSLSGDLRGVSYSSIRQGSLDERDFWRTLQTWLIEHFVGPVFSRWLRMALTTGAINLPPGKYDKFNAPIWRPRGWTWIDPLKEVEANRRAVENRLKSLQAVVGEQGVDVEDILVDNQIAEELADKYDTTLPILGGQDEA